MLYGALLQSPLFVFPHQTITLCILQGAVFYKKIYQIWNGFRIPSNFQTFEIDFHLEAASRPRQNLEK